jgi:hypothetical protein
LAATGELEAAGGPGFLVVVLAALVLIADPRKFRGSLKDRSITLTGISAEYSVLTISRT